MYEELNNHQERHKISITIHSTQKIREKFIHFLETHKTDIWQISETINTHRTKTCNIVCKWVTLEKNKLKIVWYLRLACILKESEIFLSKRNFQIWHESSAKTHKQNIGSITVIFAVTHVTNCCFKLLPRSSLLYPNPKPVSHIQEYLERKLLRYVQYTEVCAVYCYCF